MAGKQSLDNDFAARLVSLRSARGVSQQVIADMAGLTQTKYSALERGVHTPRLSPSELVALADGLGVSLATLVGSGSPADRITPIARYADDLSDGDVEALTITARQLASARAEARTGLRRVAEGGGVYTAEDERLIVRLTDAGIERTRAEQAVQALGTLPRVEPRPAPAARPAGRRHEA